MTNTNDFRRYSYQYDTSYLVNSFSMQRGSQAPKYNPQPKQQPTPELKVRENHTLKSSKQLLREQKSALFKIIKIAVVTVACFALAAMVINSLAMKNELTKQIEAKEKQIANAQSEYVSLESKLDALVSISMIDEYAVDELGMTKVKSNQIQYMDVNEYKAQREQSLNKQSDSSKVQKAKASLSGNKN